jgi:hypothetical protein
VSGRARDRYTHGTDARALRYLARAYYDADRLPPARRTLLRAAHLFPVDHTLRFNTALTMQVGFHALCIGRGVGAGPAVGGRAAPPGPARPRPDGAPSRPPVPVTRHI